MEIVGFQILIQIHHENRQEFFQSHSMLRQRIQSLTDCEFERLFEDAYIPNHFLWTERWTDADALERYMASDNFRMMVGAIEALGSLKEIRKIRFD